MNKVISMLDVIKRGATRQILSDEDLAANEQNALEMFFKARTAFETACQAVAAKSNIPSIAKDMQMIVDAVSDNSPGELSWQEQIETRWGYASGGLCK